MTCIAFCASGAFQRDPMPAAGAPDYDDYPLTLNSIYAVPRSFETREQHERFTHSDIPRRPRAELAYERERLRLRLLLDRFPDVWLLQRLERLTEALDHAC